MTSLFVFTIHFHLLKMAKKFQVFFQKKTQPLVEFDDSTDGEVLILCLIVLITLRISRLSRDLTNCDLAGGKNAISG